MSLAHCACADNPRHLSIMAAKWDERIARISRVCGAWVENSPIRKSVELKWSISDRTKIPKPLYVLWPTSLISKFSIFICFQTRLCATASSEWLSVRLLARLTFTAVRSSYRDVEASFWKVICWSHWFGFGRVEEWLFLSELVGCCGEVSPADDGV